MPAKRDSRITFEHDAADAARAPMPSHEDSSHVAVRRAPSVPEADTAFSVDEFLELTDDAPLKAARPSPLPPAPEPTPAPPPPLAKPRATRPIIRKQEPAKPRTPPPLPASELAKAAPMEFPKGEATIIEATSEPTATTSDAPTAMDLEASIESRRAPFDVPTTATIAPRRSRAPQLLASLFFVTALGGAAAYAEQHDHVASVRAAIAPRAVVAATSLATPATTVAIAPAPTETIGPPAPPMGTVIGAEEHRLWIDGHLAPSWKAIVKCGRHVVQVGSAGEPKPIDVPCDGEIVATP